MVKMVSFMFCILDYDNKRLIMNKSVGLNSARLEGGAIPHGTLSRGWHLRWGSVGK